METEYIEKHAAATIPVLPKEHRKYQTMNLDDAYEKGWHDALECVENIPPADVRENKPANWVLHDCGEATCTACGTRQKDVWDYDRVQKFCSECGAKMINIAGYGNG